MGTTIILPVKKVDSKPKRWSLATFQQRAYQSQAAIQAACAALTPYSKLLKRRKRIEYQQYIDILKAVYSLHRSIARWSMTIYDDERLPFVVYIRRYPLLSACFHVQQNADTVITLLRRGSTEYKTSLIEEDRVYQDVVKGLAALLESGKEISFEITALLDQIRFYERQRCII